MQIARGVARSFAGQCNADRGQTAVAVFARIHRRTAAYHQRVAVEFAAFREQRGEKCVKPNVFLTYRFSTGINAKIKTF